MRACLLLSVALLCLPGCGVGSGDGSPAPWAEPEKTTEEAVEVIDPFRVKLETTQGDVVIDVHPDWAPRGAKRFRELVEAGYYSDTRVFRVVKNFVVQFGINGDPRTYAKWSNKTIRDDNPVQPNLRGYVTFAAGTNNDRTTQIFINVADNQSKIDSQSTMFAPFGVVVEGMDVVDAFNGEYGEAPSEKQMEIAERGNKYLDETYPGLDSIISATIVDAPIKGDTVQEAVGTPEGVSEAPDAAPAEDPDRE